MATTKLQELQERAVHGKSSGASQASVPSAPTSTPNSTSPSMANLLGLSRGNVATSSPPLLRHEHNHTHLHLGYPPPGFPSPAGPPGTSPGGPPAGSLPTSASVSQGSSLRGMAPPAGSVTVPGAPSPSHLPPPSHSPLIPGRLFRNGNPDQRN